MTAHSSHTIEPQFAAALATLEPFERRLITLLYFGDRTQHQLADYYRLPRAVVAATVAVGLQRLAGVLDETVVILR